MNRRDFLSAATAMAVPVALNGFGVKSMAQNSALVQSLLNTSAANEDRILVMIYLSGGNDGLNTVIPLEYYSQYQGLRGNIAIAETDTLPLAGNDAMGFHPSMTGMKQLYDEGKLAIVNGVSYPNPTQSHNRSTDIWMTGVDSDRFSSTGWAGRYLDNRFPGYPASYPTADMEDPLAIQIGYIGTPTLIGPQSSVQITLKDPSNFYQLIGKQNVFSGPDLPCCDAGDLIGFVRQQQLLAVGYGAEIKAAAEAGTNLATYPASNQGNDLAEQLKIVARLIHGGLKTKIYYVELGGFDTHAGQVENISKEGVHAQLLKKLSDAILSFQNDLQLQGTQDKVMGMTFSDFGRRATANASKGTDHGIGAPMFLFGTGIKRRLIGTNPNLTGPGLIPATPTAWDPNQDIKMQIDFRRIYADILNDWFGNASSNTDNLLFRNFPTTSLFSDTVQSLGSGAWANPDLWSNGRVPSSQETINIGAGHIMEIGQNITAKKIHVANGGELKLLGNYSIHVTG